MDHDALYDARADLDAALPAHAPQLPLTAIFELIERGDR